MILCVVGSFAVNNTTFDVFVMLIFGIFCYILQKFNFPMIPLVISLVLGPLAEDNMRKAMILSRGSFSIFFTKPISLFFILLSVVLMIMPAVKNFRNMRRTN
jgi:putative tricarboxylic transport membrane protein